jgi:hypothetical protein
MTTLNLFHLPSFVVCPTIAKGFTMQPINAIGPGKGLCSNHSETAVVWDSEIGPQRPMRTVVLWLGLQVNRPQRHIKGSGCGGVGAYP